MTKQKKSSLYDLIDPEANSESPTALLRDAVRVDIPCLVNGYDWYSLLTVDREAYDSKTCPKISRDHLHYQGIVKDKHVLNRLRFTNKPDDDDNYASAYRELELHRQLMTRNISCWIRHFVIYVANEIGMKIGDSKIMTWADYMYWVENELKTRDDAMQVMKSLYISFQYLDDYKYHLTICLMITFNLSMLHASVKGIARNFVVKMITYRINQLRKQVNDACEVHNGFNMRLIRPRKDKTLQKGVPKYVFPWMIVKSEPTHQPKRKRKSKNSDNNSKTKRRNLSTYKKVVITSEEELILELASVEVLRNRYLKQLNELRNKKIAENGTDSIKGELTCNVYICLL